MSTPAWACPGCLPGRVARAQVLDALFFTNLLAVTSPFVVLIILVALVESFFDS